MWDTISFDCYGTLVDWETGIFEAFSKLAAADGVEFTRLEVVSAYHEIEPQIEARGFRAYREVLRETALSVAGRLNWPLPPERSSFLVESLPNWPVFEDTRPALKRLQKSFELAILSNIDVDLLGSTMRRIGIDFDWTVTAGEVRSYKPAPAHFEEAIRRVGGNSTRLLHAAQSCFHDVRPASELGLSTVWVNRKGEVADGPRPLHVVNNLLELADWLDV